MKKRIPQIRPSKKSSKKNRIYMLPVIILLVIAGIIGFVNWSMQNFEIYNVRKIQKEFRAASVPVPLSADFLASAPENWGSNPIFKNEMRGVKGIYKLRYYLSEELSAHPEKPIFYLIHGAPGGATNFFNRSYFLNKKLRQDFVLLAVDRPGYGESGRGQAEPQFARAIQPLLEQLNAVKEKFPQRKIYGLGWSYGGPLLALIAERSSQDPQLLIQGRQLLDGIIVVAAPADPAQEKFWWFNPLLESPLLNWMFYSGIKVANIEKMAHPLELEKMRDAWARIRIPTAYLQGTDDGIVFPQNIEFLRQQAELAGANSQVYEIQGGGHAIVFSQINLIEDILNRWQ